MTNLAIECSGTAGSVGLFDNETPICYSDLNTRFSSVRTLAGAIEQIIRGQAKPRLISVTNGPGSFTGLRVGLTTAKMLALAWDIPVVPIDTLQAIALRALGEVPLSKSRDPIITVINAFRGQVFAAAVKFSEVGSMTVLVPSCVLQSDRWFLSILNSIASESSFVSVSGPGLASYPLSGDFATVSYHTVSPDAWNPTAIEVARLGLVGLDAGLAQNAFTLAPNYIRASAAEEKTKSSLS